MTEPTQGNGTPEVPQGGDDPNSPQLRAPQYLTSEEFNRAFGARERAAEKRANETFQKWREVFSSEVAELLTAKLAEQPKPEKGDKPRTVEDAPEFKALQQQLAKMQDQLKREADLRAQTETKAKDVSLRQRIAEHASKYGIDATRARYLTGHLVDAEKRVRWSDDGEAVLMKMGDDEVDFKEGLTAFLKSDDGKFFLPPTGAAGSGDRPPSGGILTHKNTTREQLATALVGHLTGR